MSLTRRHFALAAVAAVLLSADASRAADEPTFSLEFKDGTLSPQRLEVPAKTRFRLELKNNGTTPAEFESDELKKEKVLAPGSTSSLIFRSLDPGEYPFFDDFHPKARGALIAK
ncbi:MAG: cupredoxin domain-containing protein [Beijerinckiaceae bacterium]